MSMQAVIATGGKQYLVTEGQTLKVEKLVAEPKATIMIDRVLMAAKDEDVKLGNPNVSGATVTLEVLEQGLGKKIYVETYKSKTRKHRKIGHRQSFTRVKVASIAG